MIFDSPNTTLLYTLSKSEKRSKGFLTWGSSANLIIIGDGQILQLAEKWLQTL